MAEGELEPGDAIDWREVRATAAERFGITHFRPGQRELIENVLAGRDSLGILPTGAGKSLCYQLPALFLKGLVVVVSPLIALMQDQHERLEEAEIAAARLDSTLTERERKQEERETRRGEHDIVLVTPERLQKQEHLEPLKRHGVALFVVDEAHCVSQWGHDFRPAYLELRHVIAALGHPTVLALTATAPPDRVGDILTSLGIPDARVVQGSIERENLFLEVFRTVNPEEKQERLRTILAETSGAGIVYAATVKTVHELHEWLVAAGVDAVRYHGQLGHAERETAQNRFMRGECRVIVATNAFGLGVDKPDVRFVVHWNFPDSVESYYQEAGRAGRDGERARCALFYRLEDKRVRSFFLGGKHPRAADVRRVLRALAPAAGGSTSFTIARLAKDTALGERRVSVIVSALEMMDVVVRRDRRLLTRRALSESEVERFLASFDALYDADRARLRSIMQYGETTMCRMQFIREYFGEPAGELCHHCDSCREPRAAVTNPQRTSHRRPTPTVAAASESKMSWSAGQRVRHAKFGTGEIVAAEGEMLRVMFVRGGEKRVLASYLKPVR